MMGTNNHRIFYIDFLRGIAIVCVVWGHCSGAMGGDISDFCAKFLTTFNMPLFAFVSGYLYRAHYFRTLLSYVIKCFVHLIVPVILWNLMAYLFKCIVVGFDKVPIGQHINLWYLNATFVVLIITEFIFRFFSKNDIIVLLGMILVLWMIPTNLSYVGFLYPFFVLGILINRSKYLVCKFYNGPNYIKAMLGILSLFIYILLFRSFSVSEYDLLPEN